jgi:hypothetical protein
MNAYTSPDSEAVHKRRNGQKLTLAGAVLGIVGAIGVVLSTVLNVVWLGVLGGPIGFLSWAALILGGVAFVAGFNMIKSARRFADRA